MFDKQEIVMREICNGIMFVSAVVMIILFLRYIVIHCRTVSECHKNVAVQAAACIIILLLGHAIRAFTGWMQFIFMHIGLSENLWTSSPLFLTATVLIVAGKILIVYIFSPIGWRNYLTIGAAAISVFVPILVAAMLASIT